MRNIEKSTYIRLECPYNVFEHLYSVSKQKRRDYPPWAHLYSIYIIFNFTVTLFRSNRTYVNLYHMSWKKNEIFFFVSITFNVICNSHKATSLLAFVKDTSMLVYPTICICDQRSISPLRKNSINLKNRFLLRFRKKNKWYKCNTNWRSYPVSPLVLRLLAAVRCH